MLPFTNLSGDPSQDYFADGITEDLTGDLSRIAGSFVISRNTAFTFKGKAVDARHIGRELGVRYVLEGSVRRMGDTVRVNAQLIDAGTGAHLWSEQMDVDQRTMATSQDNFGIANRLARMLSVELVNVEGRRAQRASPDAVDLAMRGWSVLNGGPTNKDDVQRSVALFEDALRIDPANSQAQVGLAQALIVTYRNRWDPEPAQVLARADEAATRAISTAPNSAQAHSVKAEALGLANRFDAALATYDRAIALDREPCGGLRWTRAELDRDGSRSGGVGAGREGDPSESARSRAVCLVLRPLPRMHASGPRHVGHRMVQQVDCDR